MYRYGMDKIACRLKYKSDQILIVRKKKNISQQCPDGMGSIDWLQLMVQAFLQEKNAGNGSGYVVTELGQFPCKGRPARSIPIPIVTNVRNLVGKQGNVTGGKARNCGLTRARYASK